MSPGTAIEQGTSYLKSWRSSLTVLGGGEEHFSRARLSPAPAVFAGEFLPRVEMVNPHRLGRGQHPLMLNNEPLPSDHGLPQRLDCCCPLCKVVARAELSAKTHQPGAPEAPQSHSPWIAQIGTSLRVLANLFPMAEGHGLVISAEHDDTARRASLEQSEEHTVLRHVDGRTRARLLRANELAEIFHFCDHNDLWASRNHPVSGMSIPFHDHWHLHLISELFQQYFRDLIGRSVQESPRSAFRARNTPFDIVVIRRTDSLRALAERTARIFNRLERQGVVATLLFNPRDGGYVLISVLDPTCGPQERRGSIGGMVFLNNVKESEQSGGPGAPALRGKVWWRELVGEDLPLRRRSWQWGAQDRSDSD